MNKSVSNRKELIDSIKELVKDSQQQEWENSSSQTYLEALATWLEDADGYYKNINSSIDPDDTPWQLIADALRAASIYE